MGKDTPWEPPLDQAPPHTGSRAQGCSQTPGDRGCPAGRHVPLLTHSCSSPGSCQQRTCFRTCILTNVTSAWRCRELCDSLSPLLPVSLSKWPFYQKQCQLPIPMTSLCPFLALFLLVLIAICHMVCLLVHCLSLPPPHCTEMSAP